MDRRPEAPPLLEPSAIECDGSTFGTDLYYDFLRRHPSSFTDWGTILEFFEYVFVLRIS